MLFLIAAALATTTPPAPALVGKTAWLVASFRQSEWCPAGNVRLDLRTGAYALTNPARRPACADPKLERPARTGTLDPTKLGTVRAAFVQTLGDRLADSACRSGRRDKLVISNGGPQILVVANGAEAWSAPDDLSCWSEPANKLHRLLSEIFQSG